MLGFQQLKNPRLLLQKDNVSKDGEMLYMTEKYQQQQPESVYVECWETERDEQTYYLKRGELREVE